MSIATPSSHASMITVVFAAGVSWLASMSAVADSVDSTSGVRQVVVSYDDLDISTLEGFQILDARLRRAVRNVCGDADIRDFGATRAVADCRSVALRAALQDLRQAGEGMNAYWLRWRAAYAWNGDEAISYD